MKIDKDSMLFTELSDTEAKQLFEAAKEIVLTGERKGRLSYFFQVWLEECGMDERQGMLLLSTAFPQRALLSLLLRNQPKS